MEMLEMLTDTKAKRSVLQSAARVSAQERAPASEKTEREIRIEYVVRLALGVGIILSWAALPLRSVLSDLTTSQAAPQQAAQEALTRTELFMPVLAQASKYCPPQERVLMLNNGSPADDLAQYYIYPRKLDLVELSQPFMASDLDAHAGGCLLYYGSKAGERLEPFRSRLTQIECSGGGCLYGIRR